MKFVSDLRQAAVFFLRTPFPLPMKLTATAIAEKLLKVALNTIALTL